MKRAQALQGPTAGRFERDVLADDIVDSSTIAHGRDVLVANPSGHAWSLGESLVPFHDAHIGQAGDLIDDGT